MIHQPVLFKETIELLNIGLEPKDTFIDATLGAGGHALGILEANKNINLVGIEQDKNIISIAQENLIKYKGQIKIVRDNFRNIKNIVNENKLVKIGGILADIGVSSLQLDEGSRGFSFRSDAALDMRMDQRQELSAELIIKTWTEPKIVDILWKYGEERQSRKIAKLIVENRKNINSTKDLAELIEVNLGKFGHIHPATKTFQALRIAVNDELDALTELLNDAPEALKVGGRLAVISFHSLEDRLVKQKFKELKQTGNFKIVTKNPVVATPEEILENRRSRSAKLRVIERVG